MNEISHQNPPRSLGQRLLGAIDLAIDVATLGEYGLEPLLPGRKAACPGRARRERTGRTTGWEALARARRGGCIAEDAAGPVHMRNLWR